MTLLFNTINNLHNRIVQWVHKQIYVILWTPDTVHCLHLDTRLTKNYDGSWKKVVEFEEMNDSFFDE